MANAIDRLREGLNRYHLDISDIQIRDGLVQRFEFTYELTHKTLKRYLELNSANPLEFDQMAFADLIRSGSEKGLLLQDWTQWKKFREMRGSTSHAYDESIALKVVAGIPEFLKEAEFLLHQINSRMK